MVSSYLLRLLPLLVHAVDPCTALDPLCPNRSEPQYQLDLTRPPPARLHSSAGPLGPLYHVARLFLQAVQPYDFSLDIIAQASRNEIRTAEVMRYEVGYLVCLILAVLYMMAMPTVGGVLVQRHRHRKNATLDSQPLPSVAPWYQRDGSVIACLSVVILLLLTGVILTFTTNSRMRENMRPTLSYLRHDISVIDEAVASVPQKVDSIIHKFSVFQTEIVDTLSRAGDLTGETITSALKPQVDDAVSFLNLSVQDVSGAKRHLLEVQKTRRSMQAEYRLMQDQLRNMQDLLHSFRAWCTQDCGTLDGAALETDADYNMIPSVDAMVDKLSFVSGFEDVLPQAEAFSSSVAEACSNQTALQTHGLLAVLDQVHMVFRNYSRRLPSLTFLSATSSQLRIALNKTQADIVYYDYVRWSVSVVFCTLILVIALLMLAGLVIGASVAMRPTLYPFHLLDQMRSTAVNLLHAAAGMTFVFSWLFIIMVFVNLLLGGNVHALCCRSWINGEIFELLDTQQHLLSGVSNTTTLAHHASRPNSTATPDFTRGKPAISTLEIYRGCETGRSLFYSMRMNETFNMAEFLNASQYLQGIREQLRRSSVNVSNIFLLREEARITMELFQHFSQLDQINYQEFQALLSREVVKTDLGHFADILEKTANLPGNAVILKNLMMVADTARQVDNVVQHQNSSRMRMRSSIEALANISQNYRMNAANTLRSASQVETSLRLQLPGLVRNASQCVLTRGAELLNQYLRVVQHSILDQVLECRWLPVSLSNMYTAACENLIGPWPGYGSRRVQLSARNHLGCQMTLSIKPSPTATSPWTTYQAKERTL
ncbi:prominin-2-like isoform X2 [Brachyhypopomus gauderio]|uniref:prominin-2-like isoform X2 n=1 Tax=Brachyhypopomus gauderio TaxID=698409 RepID=UPI0040415B61